MLSAKQATCPSETILSLCLRSNDNGVRYDPNETKTLVDTYDLYILIPFEPFVQYLHPKNTGMPWDGRQNMFGMIYRMTDIYICRNFRYDIQHYHYICYVRLHHGLIIDQVT